ncbi:uncharacterized protein [Clytia hemisphaerica]|uniref:uncharacterized protein isoform X2 n=1 Tax=Clytia hemisphaerica TaxID=252671 RepID=UPI0034D53280
MFSTPLLLILFTHLCGVISTANDDKESVHVRIKRQQAPQNYQLPPHLRQPQPNNRQHFRLPPYLRQPQTNPYLRQPRPDPRYAPNRLRPNPRFPNQPSPNTRFPQNQPRPDPRYQPRPDPRYQPRPNPRYPNQPRPTSNRGQPPRRPGPFRPPPLRDLHGYQQSPTRPGEISINFINKSGRRINMFQSLPYGHETRFTFTLRPNEPRRVSVQPDNSFWQAYDMTTSFPLYINGQPSLETYLLRQGTSVDARITSPNLRAEPVKRDRSVPRFIETQVVVDKSMLDHHGEQKVMNYTIMLMNSVTRTFLHRSFGAPIYVSVVNIHLMKNKPSYYRIVTNRPEISVPGACRYSREVAQRNNSVDFHLILTREDIGPAGFAAMYTMCSRRSCALVKENGPDTSFVVTHELAHALGIDHDEDDGCGRENLSGGNIMVKKLYATSSNFRWSKCSAKMIWQNLKYFTCLKNKPKMLPAFKKSMDWLPGELMEIKDQCRSYHGSSALPCTPRNPLTACRYLWCRPNQSAPCQPVWWHAPLEGSTCAKAKWCKRGRCVTKIKIKPVNGGWSKYSEFTPPCNRKSTRWIVQHRNRSCTNPKPRLSGKKCQGSPNQYRILIPGRNGICKPFNMRQLLLSGEIDWENIRQNGCSYKNDNVTKWRVYRESEQRRQVKSLNLTCDFESPGCGWKNSKKGVKGWNIGKGATPSHRTGPSVDNTIKTKTGKYLYFEASWVSGTTPLRRGSRVILESPIIFSSQVCMKFAYHMYGKGVGSLEIHIRRGKHSRKMWSKKGDQGDKWYQAEVELAINIEYKITIEAVRGNSYYGDIAIDDIQFSYGLCNAKSSQDDKQICTNVCITQDNSKMVRRRLPDGYPCKLPKSKNNVCFRQVCQPVNCHGVINGRKC